LLVLSYLQHLSGKIRWGEKNLLNAKPGETRP